MTGLMGAVRACCFGLAVAGAAYAQSAPAPPSPRADPAFDLARVAFEPLPEADRRALQDALVWTGDFNSVASGEFGRRTFDAITAWQKRQKAEPTGVLDAPARAALLAAGRRAKDAVGFTLRTDPATGVIIGVPTKLLTQFGAMPHGSRWASADARVTLETRSIGPDEGDLDATFERMTAAAPDRKITYKLRRPEFFVISGDTATGRFFTRYAATPAGLRGFSLSYDKARAPEVDRIVIAVANAFVPVSAPPASGSAAPSGDGTKGPGPTPTFSALEIAPGRVVTSVAALGSCNTPRVAGVAGRIIAKSDSLALIESAANGRTTLTVGPQPPTRTPLTVLASLADDVGAVSAQETDDGRLVAPLQPGAAGAPVFDRAGRVVGIVGAYPPSPAMINGVVPAAPYPLVRGQELDAFLKSAGVAPASARGEAAMTTGEIAAMVGSALKQMDCPGGQ